MPAIPSRGWLKRTMTVTLKTNSGRNRRNSFGAYSPYNHAPTVTDAAKARRIELLYLPPYSPNLNLMALYADVKRHRALGEVSQAQGGT